MTLRKKTLWGSAITLLALTGVIYGVAWRILVEGFVEVERQQSQETVRRVLEVIGDDINKIDLTTSDWAGWDETYQFASDGQLQYIRSNLTNAALSSLSVNVVVFVNSRGKVVYGTGYDLTTLRKYRMPAGLYAFLKPDSVLLKHATIKTPVKGLLQLPEGLLMVSSRPILTSEKKGPSRGSLIFGRFVNANELHRLSQITHYQLSLKSLTSTTPLTLPPDATSTTRAWLNADAHQTEVRMDSESELDTRVTMISQRQPWTEIVNEDQILGEAELSDIYDRPVSLLRVPMNRHIFQQAQHSARLMFLLLLLIGIAFCGLLLFVLEHSVLRRLTHLSSGVSAVSTSGDASQRISEGEGGHDELSRLANDINTMLMSLQGTQRELKRSEEWLARIVETNADAIILVDCEARITFANAAAERIFGLPRADLLQRQYDDPAWRIATSEGEIFSRDKLPFRRVLQGGEPVYHVQHALRKATGELVILSVNAAPLRDSNGEIISTVCSITDITSRRQMEARLQHQAFHDALTGLPNRALFRDRLENALSRARRNKQTLAVLFIDLDNFKIINDSLGHAAGDELLRSVAERLQRTLRGSDTAARLGGDEFIVILEELQNSDDALMVAGRLLRVLEAPMVLEGREIVITPSVGIALSSEDEIHAEELLRHADAAMYEAKKRGKARCEVFRSGMSAAALQRLETENDLRHAVARGELVLHFQPKMNLASGLCCAVEALVRWQHPTRGMVPPNEFIPLAEETGLILPVGQWVLEQACQQARAWQNRFETPLRVAVNLSARQLKHPGLLEDIRGALRRSGIEPSTLVLEITESVLMEEGDDSEGTLSRLKELGVRLAIDDFGTGYSSLSYLKRFPVDDLKIDRCFVSGMGQDAQGSVIVSSIVQLAHALNLHVVAEGVETPQQAEELKRLGCDTAQGFFFARPLSTHDAEGFIAKNLPSPEVKLRVV